MIHQPINRNQGSNKLQTKQSTYEAREVTDIVSKKQYEVYTQVFDDIIKQDTAYGGLLVSVKKNYEDYIQQLIQSAEDLKSQVKTPHFEGIQGQLARLQEENTALDREKTTLEDNVKKVCSENKRYYRK